MTLPHIDYDATLHILHQNGIKDVQFSTTLFTTILTAFILARLLRNKFRNGLSNLPGPTLASWSRLWVVFDVYKGKHMDTMMSLHKKHGPVVRIGPNKVSIAESAAIKVIYAPSAKFLKSEFYDVMNIKQDGKFNEENPFATRNEVMHTNVKRPLAPLFSALKLLTYEKRVDETSELFFVHLTKRFASTGIPFDLGQWVQFYAFDVIAQITFSKPIGFLDQGKDIDGVIKGLYLFNKYGAIVGQYPELHSLLLANPIIGWFSDPRRSNPVVQFVEKIFKDRNEETDVSYRDMIQDITDIHRRSPEKVPAKRVVDVCTGNLIAGSDTTAIALRSLLHNLLINPHCYAKLRNEIDNKDKNGELSLPIQMKEASAMPYLQACLKEAMRMHPSVGLGLERVVPKGGATICGRFFPEGTVVGVNPFVSGRDKAVYGEDVDTFRPERWIEADSDQLLLMERNFLAFGAGKRLCLGKHVSLLEMSKLVPELIRRFDITLEDASKDLQVHDYWFAFQQGLHCRIAVRY
ncbi:pisatin demethylase [Camillea tinctor]|nr:pisatin demethylase [Camillea tinctor]